MVQAQEHHHHPLSFSGRLKYADPKSLPSYPSRGHSRDATSASAAAAALGWAKQNHSGTKTMTEHRENSPLPSAAALAASIAAVPRSSSPRRDGPRGQPASSNPVSRSLQNGSSPRHDLGGSAAMQAFNARSPRVTPRVTPKNSSSLLAAQKATRPRSSSSPIIKQSVPEQSPGIGSGRGDDGTTHKRSEIAPGSGSGDASAASASAPSRSMYTANPPVSLEVEENRKAEELHASAVAMARNIFKQQPRLTESILSQDDDPSHTARAATQSGQNPNLQEAAYKLAHERLSKLHDENLKNREFQDYYTPPSGTPRRRSTVAAKLRRRASSDSDIDFRGGRASNRLSLFSSLLPNLDETSRDKDRENVLAAARKNVRAQLDDMDQAVADRTGMAPPSTKSVWESKAHALAQARIAAAATVEDPHKGQRDVGGGRYVAQGEIDAVAAKNVKPILLEINERAEKEHERQRVLKEEMEEKRVEAEAKKAHEREVKEILRKLKAEQKEKDKERQQTIKEEERIWKSEKLRRKEVKTVISDPTDGTRTGPVSPREGTAGQEEGVSHEGAQRTELPRRTTPPNAGNVDEGESREQALSPGKVKSWLRAKLTRQKPSAKVRDDSELGRGFVGGHVLRSPETSRAATVSSTALPGQIRNADVEERAGPEGRRSPPPSRGVSSGTDATFEDARESVSPPKTPPRMFAVVDSRSPTRDSRFKEIMD